MIDIDTLKGYLPDPYAYERNFFEILVPMNLPVIDINTISSTEPGPKIALFMKVTKMNTDRAKTKHWEFVKTY
jgi:hypothetical protein